MHAIKIYIHLRDHDYCIETVIEESMTHHLWSDLVFKKTTNFKILKIFIERINLLEKKKKMKI